MRIAGTIASLLDGARFADFWFFIGVRLLGGESAELAGTEPCFDTCFGLLGIGVAPALLAAAAARAAADSMGMVTSNYCSTRESAALTT